MTRVKKSFATKLAMPVSKAGAVEKKTLQKNKQLFAGELENLRLLQKISNLIIEDEQETTIYEAIIDAAMELMHSDFASIQILNQSEKLLLGAWKNFHPESARYWEIVDAGSGSVCGQALLKKDRVIIPDINVMDASQHDKDEYIRSQIVSVQSTPLISRSGKCVGMMSTHWRKKHQPKEIDFNSFDVLARQAADLIERKQAMEELRKSEAQLRQFNNLLEAQATQRSGELTKSREDLHEKNMELEQTVAQLESFNYIASHDLQEPLRKIQTFIELLNDLELQNLLAKDYINAINVSSVRMSDLINSLLKYSRISHGSDAFEPVDLNKILSNVKTDYEIVMKEKKGIITCSRLPTIRAVPFQMHQLFANLIGNSLKFSKRTPEIIISSRIVKGKEIESENGFYGKANYAELIFSDNGIGFENKYKKKIFEVFQRLHAKSTFSGTGIGLSIVDKIVRNHHGFIQADGGNGSGAVFTVYLPVE